MKITQFTDYGLRVLMYLSYQDHSDRVTISEIADTFSIPRNHLVKVVNRLVKSAWVEATRGRNGGLKLAIAPQTLGLGTVIKELEGHNESVDCNKTNCILVGQCHLKNMLESGMQTYFQAMNQYTLADAVEEPTWSVITYLHQLKSHAS